MKKEHLIAYFGSGIAAGRALGVSKQAVSNWEDIIPEGVAYKAEVVTHGDLKVDPKVYDRIRRQRYGHAA